MLQSKVPLEGTPLMQASIENRFKTCNVLNIKDVIEVFEILLSQSQYQPTLLILEAISSILQAERVKINDRFNSN